jgi:uncharacterized protein
MPVIELRPEMIDAARRKRRAFAAVALLVPAPTIGVLAAMWVAPGPLGSGIFAFTKLWLVSFPAFWHLLVDRGFVGWSPPRRGGLRAGLLLGLGIGAAIAAAYFLVGVHWIDRDTFRRAAERVGFAAPGRYAALALYTSTLNALLEEYVWRWFLVRKLELLVPPLPAILLSALFFTIHHVLACLAHMPVEAALLASAGVFIGGVIWSGCFAKYRSIWPGAVSHSLADLALFGLGALILFGDGAAPGGDEP